LKRIGLLIAVAAVAFLIFRHWFGTPARDGDDGEAPLATETPAVEAAPLQAPAPSAAAAAESPPAAPPPTEIKDDPFPRCPDTQPVAGSACPGTNTATLRCAYTTSSGEVACDCVSASPGTVPGWRCMSEAPAQAPAGCPEASPGTGTTCAWVGQLCRYGTVPDAVMCRCEAAGWSCRDYWEWRHKK
jgi:hypothetical protein